VTDCQQAACIPVARWMNSRTPLGDRGNSGQRICVFLVWSSAASSRTKCRPVGCESNSALMEGNHVGVQVTGRHRGSPSGVNWIILFALIQCEAQPGFNPRGWHREAPLHHSF
jgi:hypothetical protein